MNDYTWNGYKKNRESGSIRRKKKNIQRSVTKPYETEEEAILRRFHDAQRMARFRARKRKALEEAKVAKTGNFNQSRSAISKVKNITLERIDSMISISNITQFQSHLSINDPPVFLQPSCNQSKYSQLLRCIQELGKDIRLMYAGSKISAERTKIGIVKARMLVKECLSETKLNSRDNGR